jgi:hypothetical protein
MECGGEGGWEFVRDIELVGGFLKRAVPHDVMEPELVCVIAPDGERDWLNSSVEKRGVPQRAQDGLVLPLLSPGILVDMECDGSCRRVFDDIGSIVN